MPCTWSNQIFNVHDIPTLTSQHKEVLLPHLVLKCFLHLRRAARQLDVTVHHHRVESRLHLRGRGNGSERWPSETEVRHLSVVVRMEHLAWSDKVTFNMYIYISTPGRLTQKPLPILLYFSSTFPSTEKLFSCGVDATPVRPN